MNGRCLKPLTFVLLLLVAPLLATAVFADDAPLQQAQSAQDPEAKKCKDNGECDRSQYCQKRAGKCEGQGICVVRPQVCPFIFDPVCGCDGMTYSNACVAASNGVNVRSAGPCPANCAKNSDCARDQYCSKPAGQCDARGLCATRPQACPRIFDPVCGCDNKVYPSPCNAASEGVNVKSFGETCPR